MPCDGCSGVWRTSMVFDVRVTYCTRCVISLAMVMFCFCGMPHGKCGVRDGHVLFAVCFVHVRGGNVVPLR